MTKLYHQYITAAEAIKAAKLDFNVVKLPVYTKIGDQEVKIKGKYTTVRMDKPAPIGVVGNVYTIVQNTDSFSFIDDIARNNEVLFTSVNELSNSSIALCAQMGDDVQMGISKKDRVTKTLILSNSHNGSTKVRVKFVIQNKDTGVIYPFSLPNFQTVINIKHTYSAPDKVLEGKRVMKAAHLAFDEILKIFNKMMQKEISVPEAKNIVFKLFVKDGKNISTRLQNVVNSIEDIMIRNSKNSMNLWEIYQAVAEYYDTKKSKKDTIKQKTNVLLGSANYVKESTFTKLVKMI